MRYLVEETQIVPEYEPEPETQLHDFGYRRDPNFRISGSELRSEIETGSSCVNIAKAYGTTQTHILRCVIELGLIDSAEAHGATFGSQEELRQLVSEASLTTDESDFTDGEDELPYDDEQLTTDFRL